MSGIGGGAGVVWTVYEGLGVWSNRGHEGPMGGVQQGVESNGWGPHRGWSLVGWGPTGGGV